MEKEVTAAGVELTTMTSFGVWVSGTTELLCHDREGGTIILTTMALSLIDSSLSQFMGRGMNPVMGVTYSPPLLWNKQIKSRI